MAKENICLESANVALIRGPYREIVEESLRSLASSEDVLVIDVMDVCNTYTFAKFGLTMPDIAIFTPITAYHLKQFIEEELSRCMAEKGAKTIAVLGLNPLFYDPNILDFEYVDLFRNIVGEIRRVATENGSQVLILTSEETPDCSRDAVLTEELDSIVDYVFNLNEMKVCATH
tara:strand:+ start:1259 stop:1780 length:522 start_codon:yes stop_codon:yes gene_type:complete